MEVFLGYGAFVFVSGGVLLGIFVILLLNNRSVRKSRANLFLSILLAALTFSVLHSLLGWNIRNEAQVSVFQLGNPTFFLIAPLLWFYTQELTGVNIGLSRKRIAHLIPFAIVIIIALTSRYVAKHIQIVTYSPANPNVYVIVFWLAIVVQFSVYQLFIQRNWHKYRIAMEQEVSNTEDVNISWIRFFMGIFLLINVFFLFTLFAVIHLQHIAWLGKAISFVFTLSIFALGYKGILQKEIFLNHFENSDPDILAKEAPAKPQDPHRVDKLLGYMRDKKPYLDPELTLSGLALQLGMNRGQLSSLINEGIGDNFYNFINKYRVEQVKEYMADPARKRYSLLGMALDAGFKSKSTFNLIFKRFTGLTPTGYNRNISSPGRP